MKLLVAGDSFAEFSGFRNHFSIIDPSSYNRSEKKYPEKFDHWCELLANLHEGTAISHGLGAHDVSSTSFIALQQILKGDYTHVIFFVSDFFREMTNANIYHESDWLYRAVEVANYNPLSKFYTEHELYSAPKITNTKSEELRAFLIYKNGYKEYTPHQSGIRAAQQYTDLKHWHNKPEITNYIFQFPVFRYIHDRIGNICLLKDACKEKNIPILFVDAFCQDIASLSEFISNIDVFNLCDVERTLGIEYEGSSRIDYPTHFYKDEHPEILKIFLEKFPDWGK